VIRSAWPTTWTAELVGVFAVSGLTDWERHRLAGLERQLTQEDPRLAARLQGRVDAPPSWARRRIGWLMIVAGVVLALCGSALKDPSVTLSGFLVLSFCWVPFWGVRHAGDRSGP
jgi:hypothetical protein